MNSTIDFRTLPQNVPSLCIPRVFININEQRIRKIFDELNMGIIERVDIISKNTDKGEKFNRVFIHFKKWFSEGNAQIARERVLNGKEIKIIYDDPWFWKVSAYREIVRKEVDSKKLFNPTDLKKRPTIEFDLDEDDNKNIKKNSYIKPKFNENNIINKYNNKKEKSYKKPIYEAKKMNKEDFYNKYNKNEVVRPRSPSNSPPPSVATDDKSVSVVTDPIINQSVATCPDIKLKYGELKQPKKITILKKKSKPLIIEEGEVEIKQEV